MPPTILFLQLMLLGCCAMFVQSVSGFGSGLVSMPFLIQLLGATQAAATFAIASPIIGWLLIWRYRKHLNIRRVWRIILAALIFIPLGVKIPEIFDKDYVLMALGIITLGYSTYSLLGLHIPKLHKNWGFLVGMIGGLLHGAFNTGGPPYIIYGTGQRWQPFEFKGNIQTIFFITGFAVIASHMVNGNITQNVLINAVAIFLGMLIGIFLGGKVDRFIKPEPFRKGTLILLAILGITLIF